MKSGQATYDLPLRESLPAHLSVVQKPFLPPKLMPLPLGPPPKPLSLNRFALPDLSPTGLTFIRRFMFRRMFLTKSVAISALLAAALAHRLVATLAHSALDLDLLSHYFQPSCILRYCLGSTVDSDFGLLVPSFRRLLMFPTRLFLTLMRFAITGSRVKIQRATQEAYAAALDGEASWSLRQHD
jgi:hypothetical protein